MIRLFRVFVPSSVVALLVSEAVLIFSCYVLAVIAVLGVDPEVFLLYDNGWARIGVVTACIMLAIYFQDLYTNLRVKSRILLLQQAGLALGGAFLAQALMVYLRLRDLVLPTWIMISGSALTLILLPLWRILYAGLVVKAIGSERILFLGVSALVREISAYLIGHPETGLLAIGCVADGAETGEIGGLKVLGKIADLRRIVDECKPDRVVVGMEERRSRMPVNQLLDIRLGGTRVEDVLNTCEATFGRISTRELRPAQLIFSSELGPNPGRVMLQSIYSMIIAVFAAVLTAPILLLVAAAVRLSSRGPALFRQQRVGKDNVPFTLYKFRSMYLDAESRSGAVWAQKDDPRVTRAGKWLRKFRLDELPQLLNVLKGEMSIVGPRPERPEFVEELEKRIPYYRQRHCVKPGITGWAQINHKYGDTVEDSIAKLEYDLYYIKNLAPALDAYIMFQTAKVMLLSRGSQ